MADPLAIDLCCGLGGWTEGLLAEGVKGYVPKGTKALGKHGHPRILPQIVNKTGSGSKARKAASAKIAKIPLALSSHIARVYKPKAEAA